jgi:hypothetical protein
MLLACEPDVVSDWGQADFAHRAVPRGGRWRRFVHRYGWRAYALPLLSAVTVAAILHPAADDRHDPAHAAASTQSAGQSSSLVGLRAAAPIQIGLGTDSTPCTANALPQFILVSITDQRVWMCQQHTQMYSTLVTTGAVNVGDGTPLGTWQIQDKQTNRYLVGPGYRDFVHYWMPFNGDFGFHDAPWQTMAYGAPGYTDNGSHGCVHLPAAAMAWLYNWAPTGTTVTIQA